MRALLVPDVVQKFVVMPGVAVRRTASLPLAYVPGIHVLGARGKAWMAGTSPAMTVRILQALITYSETPGGMSASVTPTSSIFVMIALRMKPRPLLKSIQVLT
jgi:hypothetical protein